MHKAMAWFFAGLPSLALVGLSVYFALTISPWWIFALSLAAVMVPEARDGTE